VIGDIVDVLRTWAAAVPILIKPFLYVIAFGPIAVLFCQCDRAGVLVADHVCSSHCMAAQYRPKAPQLCEFTAIAERLTTPFSAYAVSKK
jgi:hypothetical protein